MLPIQVLTRHEAGVNCLAVYGNLIFTGSEDKDIKVLLLLATIHHCFFLRKLTFFYFCVKVYKYFKLFTATPD